MFSDNTCDPGPTSQVIANIAAALGAAANNGGPTPTVALSSHSPAAFAVDARATAPGTREKLCGARGLTRGDGLFAVDQRGAPRPGFGGPDRCAAGAFEPAAAFCGAISNRPECFR